MQEPYEEGPANRLGLGSDAGDGNIAGVARTEAHAGQPLSSEIIHPACRPCNVMGKATHSTTIHGEPANDAAESQTLRMHENSSRGNRESPSVSWADGGQDRSEKAQCRTADMHAPGQSDGLVVPEKRANNIGVPPVAESVEGRGSTKGNATRTLHAPDAEPGKRGIGLLGVREAARHDKKMRFTTLLHHITPELLQASFLDLKRQAAPGIDGVTWQDYANDLEARIDDLHDRVHRGTYRAQPSKRAWIPKPDGRQRPLGLVAAAGRQNRASRRSRRSSNSFTRRTSSVSVTVFDRDAAAITRSTRCGWA